MENKPRILLVQGDGVRANTLSTVLKTNGYDVGVAWDSEDAIAYLQKRPVELVFIESKMLLTDGVEIYERINEIRPEVEIVVMRDSLSTDDSLKDIEGRSLWGPLRRPFTIDKLLAIIEDFARFRTAALVIPAFIQHFSHVPDQKAA